VSGLPAPDAVLLPGDEVTVYEVIAEPPSDAGGVNVTVACPFPAVAATPVGAPGAVVTEAGVTWFDTLDGTLVPAEFVALTVKVYAVPFVSPETVIGLPAPVAVMLPGDEVTV
jgi:hypothetical protein